MRRKPQKINVRKPDPRVSFGFLIMCVDFRQSEDDEDREPYPRLLKGGFADDSCWEDLPRGRMPPHVDHVDGFIHYNWDSRPGESIRSAVGRAVRRCNVVRDRTGLDWHLDDEAMILVDGKCEGYADIQRFPTFFGVGARR